MQGPKKYLPFEKERIFLQNLLIKDRASVPGSI